MKPILVQQKSNDTLWWVVDWKISIHTPPTGNTFITEPSMHRVYTLIPANTKHGGSRINLARQYRLISN